MSEDRLTISMSESCLTLLAFNREFGTQALLLITPDIFEPPLDTIATKIIEYRHQYHEPPGLGHIDDIFDGFLKGDDQRANNFRRILTGLIDQSGNLNPEYVFSRLRKFVRLQQLKKAIFQAGTRYEQAGDQDTKATEIERILHNALKDPSVSTDLGTRLDDLERSLAFLTPREGEYCSLGIDALDRRKLIPTRKELYLLIGPRKSGKSMFCIHAGKRGALQRWNVLHVTLEVSEEIVAKRYFQSLLTISNRKIPFPIAVFDEDNTGKLSIREIERIVPTYSLDEPGTVRDAIKRFVNTTYKMRNGSGRSLEIGFRFHNLIIKFFPSGTLTIPKLENYLDTLDQLEHFQPDLLIVDYPQLMKIDTGNYRLDLGQIGVELRGIAAARNLAVVAVAQGNRLSESASLVQGHHIAEDISLVATADTVITLSKTVQERRLGLARLFVADARNEEDKFTVLLQQSYATAQFVLGSYPMGSIVDSYNSDVQTLADSVQNDD